MNKNTNKIALLSVITASFIAATGYSVGISGGKDLIEKRYDKAFEIASEEKKSKSDGKTFFDGVEESSGVGEKDKTSKGNSSSTNNEKKSSKNNSSNKSARNSKNSGASSNSSNSIASVGNISLPNKLKDGTYYGTANGYAGPIKVKVVISGGKISNVEVVSHSETPGYYEKGAGIISKILSSGSPNVDTVSGATLTSGAIKKAVQQALKNAGDTSQSQSSSSGGQDKDSEIEKLLSDNKRLKNELEKAKQKVNANMENLKIENLKDGTYDGEGTGFEGRKTKVSVEVSGGKLKSINIVSYSDDEDYFVKAKSIIGKIIEGQSLKVDAVSGATFSSNGIKSAVADALKKAGLKVDSSSQIEELKKSVDDLVNKNKELSDNINSLEGEYRKLKNQLRSNSGSKLKDGIYEGDGLGFMRRAMKVQVSVQNGKIASVNLLSSSDDEPYLSNAKTIISKFIGKSSSDGIDAISGATYSSNGIKDAVDDALMKARTGEGSNSGDKTLEETEKVRPNDDNNLSNMTDIHIKDEIELHSEDILNGKTNSEKRAVVEENLKNIEKNISIKEDDKGILESTIAVLEKKLEELRSLLSSINERLSYFKSMDIRWKDILREISEENQPEINERHRYRDGIFRGSSSGYKGRAMIIEITIKNDKITDIREEKIGDDLIFVKTVKNTMYPKIKENIDVDSVDSVSGATFTSNGIKNAIKEALSKAEIKN